MSAAQVYTPRPASDDAFSSVFFYVRGRVDVATLLREIPGIVASVDPTLPANSLAPLERTRQQQRRSGPIDRLAVGGVRRARDSACRHRRVRRAELQHRRTHARAGSSARARLEPRQAARDGAKQVGWVALVGAAVGLVAAFGVGRLASALLFGLSGYDPLVFGGALAVIAVVVLCATYLPARKASQVAPMEALRHE